MTRRERRWLLVCAIVLALVCCALFARAVLAERAAGLARAQARAALLPTRTPPASDVFERAMLDWTGASGQMRFWQALQRFRTVAADARRAGQYTLAPLPLIFRLEQTIAALQRTAAEDHSRQRRSRLEDMIGLAYFYDATLHRGEDPVEPQLEGKAAVAFRRAILLDRSNNTAKTNLEWLLRRQLRRKKGHAGQSEPVPGQTRAEGAIQSAIGIPSQNGSVGRRFSGGY